MLNKIKTINQKISFVLVGDSMLNYFLDYLSRSLSWPIRSKASIRKFIINSNIKNKYYGLAILDESNIVGGILFINQGNFNLKKNIFEVVNISNLHVDNEYRGLISFEFINTINKFLDKYIVTDYTPNEKTIKIFRKFNFSIADSFSYRLTIFKIFEFHEFIKKSKNIFLESNNSYRFKPNLKKNKIISIRYCFNGEEIIISLSSSYSKVSLGLFILKFRKLRILSVSNNNLFKEKYLIIILTLMIRNRSPVIYIDFLDNNIKKNSLSQKSIKKHLIKVKNGLPNLVAPLGSEISISH